MDDTLAGMLFGVLIGALLSGIAVFATRDTYHRDCAQKHDVFACEAIWVPVTPEATP